MRSAPRQAGNVIYQQKRARRRAGDKPRTVSRESRLIEHPNGIYSANIALDGDNGPQVKGPRWDGQSEEWADPGMFATAAELDAGLRELLGPFVLRDITEPSQ